MKTVTNYFLVSMLVLLMGAGCKTEDNGGPPEPDQSTMNVRLTDAAGSYEKVVINVQDALVHHDGQGWISLPLMRKGEYDLVTLTNGVDVALAGSRIPVGTISQFRLVLGAGNYLVKDGIRYELETPSAQESGLKINIHQTLVKDVSYTLWIDFDANKSINENPNGFKLKPVMRGYFIEAGSLSGVVNPAANADEAYAVNSHAVLDTFHTWLRPDGYYKLVGLTPGLFDVTFKKSGAVVKTVQSVSVGSAANTDMGTVMVP